MFQRLLLLIKRMRRARQLGLKFRGTRSFSIPPSARINDRHFTLQFPDDLMAGADIIDVWLDDDYGLEKLKYPINTIVDIGGNVGLFSLMAYRNFPGAKIHVYEPDPVVLPFLRNNLAQISHQVTVWSEGVSSRVGRAEMKLFGSSLLGQTKPSPDGEIPLCPLSEVVTRIGGFIDLLKLDCEGAEWSIFEKPEPFSHVRDIRMEYHLTDGRTLDDLYEAADKIGFEVTHLRENNGFGIVFLSNRSAKL